jgi:hypothetical protein
MIIRDNKMRILDNIYYINLNIYDATPPDCFYNSWLKLRNQQDIHIKGYLHYSTQEETMIYTIDESYIDKIFTILNIVESNIF